MGKEGGAGGGEYVDERVLVPATVIYAREVLRCQIDGTGEGGYLVRVGTGAVTVARSLPE